MLYITVLRVVAGFALLGMLGVIVALVTQFGGMTFLNHRLNVRDRRESERNGWPKRSDFVVVGEPGWQEKLHQMMYPKRKNRS